MSSSTCQVGINSIPSDWQSVKDNCIKPSQPFNFLSPPSITLSDFAFQDPPALSCCVAISVGCLRLSCQTHFNHSLAPVMLHSDEEWWRDLKTVHIFALMFFGSFFLFPSYPHVYDAPSPIITFLCSHFPNESHPSGRGRAVAVLACTSGKEKHI